MRTWLDQIVGGLEAGVNEGFRETDRQRALSEMRARENQQRQQTMRQRAFDRAIQLRGAGYDVTPEQIMNEYTGEAQQIRQEEMAPNFEGPPRPGLFDRRTAEFEAKQAQQAEQMRQAQIDQGLNRQLKQAQIAQMSQPFEQSREAQKMRFTAGLKGKKQDTPREFKQNQYAAGG